MSLIARMTGALFISAVALAPPAFASAPTPAPATAQETTFEELDKFMDVFQRVRSSYVRKVDDHTLLKVAIDGMLAALDPHSGYAEGKDYDDLKTITDAEYAGVGVITTVDGGFVRVVSTTEDTPAWRAGIKPKDFITHVDGKLIYDLPLDEATDQLRGKPGSQVRLTLRREGAKKPIELTLTRAVIDVRPVKWEVKKRVGIINLNIFNGRSGDDVRDAVNQINAATADGPLGYILDLRSNGGGIVDEAVDIADLFLEQGEIVSRRGRDPKETQRYYARPGDLAKGRPVVVLVDSGTASASEIVAGALQDHHRALVVGERSFGKGSVQSIMTLGDRRALRLTTELYYLPSGRSIQGEGIDPDIQVPQLSDADRGRRLNIRESDLRRHLIAEAATDDAALVGTDPPNPRFAVSAAALKRQGVADYQLDYAIKIIGRLGPASIAERPAKPAAKS